MIKMGQARVIQSPTGDLVSSCFVRGESHGDAFFHDDLVSHQSTGFKIRLRRGTEGAGAYREDPALGWTVTWASYLNPSLP